MKMVVQSISYYINPNSPVYFTYARNSIEKAEWKNIADVIPDLLQIFKDERIKYSVDVEDIKNGAKISSYEKEIGNAQYVIVVLSDRYFYRYHCMFELFNVLKNTHDKTIKFIKSGDFNIKNIDYRAKIKEFWRKEKASIENRIATYRNPDISELEQAAIDNNYYLDFIDSLASLFNSVSYTNADNLRRKLLGSNPSQIKFVNEIKKDLGWRPQQSSNSEPKISDEESVIRIKEKHILYFFIAVLVCVVLWFAVRSPESILPINGGSIDTSTNTINTVEKHSFVDLGLSVLWATCNVGADNPWDFGDSFAWGEVIHKKRSSWDNYKYCKEDRFKLTKYCYKSKFSNNDFEDNKILLAPADDAATANMSNGWRMPTANEFQELIDNCDYKWTTEHGIKGALFTSKKNKKTIFLPAENDNTSGVVAPKGTIMATCIMAAISGVNTYSVELVTGYYWSSSLSTERPDKAQSLIFGENGVHIRIHDDRCYALFVRAVCSKN